MQCGQFVEYLCNLVPGMWAEKLYDGHFMGLSPYKFEFIKETDFREKPWYPSGAVNRAEYSQDSSWLVSGVPCEKISVPNGPKCAVGLSQDGIAVGAGQPCKVSVWLKASEALGNVVIRLRDGQTLAECTFRPGAGWRKFTARLVPSAESSNATFSIGFTGPGTLWLDAVSLMPERNVGGWRSDVVRALRLLKPGVIRIGGSVMDDPNLGSFEWKDTVGDPDFRRPFHAWGGLQPTGPGLAEFVDLCRAVKAEPLICVRTRDKTPKDAADEVEYFNGDASTRMGALRAKNGHPKPYGVKFWQVGNERSGAEYEADLPKYCQAMRAADPGIKLFSSFPTEGVLKGAGAYLNYTCPHHYDCANLQEESDDFAYVRKLIADNAPGRNIKVAVTEWNTTAGDRGLRRAGLWDLQNALACARYQNLMHRNCDLVEIANRSNLTNSFCSGILQTDNHRLYMTPTYYAQRLYANLAGSRPLRIDPPAPLQAGLDISATDSADGRALTVFAVNDSLDEVSKTLKLPGGAWVKAVETWTLADGEAAGEPDATNSFDDPFRVSTHQGTARLSGAELPYRFPSLSLVVLRFTKR